MKVLITGCAGFIGSHTVDKFLPDNNYNIVGLDKFTYAAKESNLESARGHDRFKMYRGDICDFLFLKKICIDENINWIINFAAETHVDNSIKDSKDFLRTNIGGVVPILNVCKDLKINLLHISTDEVYGSKKSGSFTETDKLNPRNPYSATKAAAEHMIKSYENTHDVNAIIVRPSNNFGPRQHSEKFLPTIIKSINNDLEIPVYGTGKQIREWLYVKDNASAIKFILEKGDIGSIYNITSSYEVKNLDFIDLVYESLEKTCNKKIKFVQDRLGHDFRYSIDNNKLKSLGFDKFTDMKDALRETLNEEIK